MRNSQDETAVHLWQLREKAAAIVYSDLKESQRAAFHIAAEWGRWLIASLLLINGGALWGLLSYFGAIKLNAEGLGEYRMPIWCFIVGIVLAVLSGLSAWANWQMHWQNFMHMARYDMLWDPNQWANDPRYSAALDITYRVSIVTGIASLASAVCGGAFLLHGNFIANLL